MLLIKVLKNVIIVKNSEFLDAKIFKMCFLYDAKIQGMQEKFVICV